jgi:hypothetical protein
VNEKVKKLKKVKIDREEVYKPNQPTKVTIEQ